MFNAYIRVAGTLQWLGGFATYGDALHRAVRECQKTPGHGGWEVFEPEEG